MRLRLSPGERRGYWKHVVPTKSLRQTLIPAKLNDSNAKVLLDTGAEVSILSSSFARELGLDIDTDEELECVGVGGAIYRTEGRANVKITLASELVYQFTIWVGDLDGQDAILGMDFMVPAGIRLDMADGSVCMPDEIRVYFDGRKQIFSSKMRTIYARDYHLLHPGEYMDIEVQPSREQVLWLTR